MKNDDTVEIFDKVAEYITKKQDSKKWIAGKDWVQYAGPFFTTTEYIAAISSLLNGWLVLGEDASLFEKRFSKLFNKQFGLLTNSGSSANLLMLLALKSKKGLNLPIGTKVITPVSGFPTTINPILQVGFKPIFVDVELDTLNLDLDQVEQLCSEQSDIKVLMFAHALGNPPDMNRLINIVEKYNLILLEDCCDSLGSTYDNKPLGSFGMMSSCSFYPAHHITMGEGGIVTTNDLTTLRILKSFRDWGKGCYCEGKSNLSEKGVCGKRFSDWLPDLPDHCFDHKYIYDEIGYNLKPIELQASIGLAQLDKLNEIISKRKENYKLLFDIFSKYDDVFKLHSATPLADPCWFAFPITIKDTSNFSRTSICEYFEANKIQTRPYFAGNILLQPAYVDIHEDITKYPIANKITTNTFFLGTSPVITKEQIEYIEQILTKFMKR